MRVIQQGNGFISDLISSKRLSGKYKASQFNILKEISGQYILFNTFTREILSLSENEYHCYNAGNFIYDGGNEFIGALIDKGFIVCDDIDELKRYKEVLGVYRLVSTDPNKKIVQYKIFATTYCNARCFYCFEEGMTYNHMTLETAENVVQYILKTCVDGIITLYWFGGEPLCNVPVIDYICKRLREENKEYVSKIITNGYLFDESIIDKAVNLWNLIFAQITLDGTEEEHNRRKSYIKAAESPFKRTIRNIHLLLDAGISVVARLNFDEDNIEDINRLIDTLPIEFNHHPKFRAYTAILSNNWLNHQTGRSLETEEILHKEFLNISQRLENYGLYNRRKISNKPKPYFCMAANPACATISAKGELYTCQSCDDKMRFGTVVDGVTDYDLLNQWENCLDTLPKCDKCPFLPECCVFNKCPAQKGHCVIDKDFAITKQLRNLLSCSADNADDIDFNDEDIN